MKNKCLLKALRRRWPEGNYSSKFLVHELQFLARKWLLDARRTYSRDGWFIQKCSSRDGEHTLRALKNIPIEE